MTEPMHLAWMPAFLADLTEHGVVAYAARRAGMSPGAAYSARQRHAEFAGAWAIAQAAGEARRRAATATPACAAEAAAKGRATNWRVQFFEALAETSNVTAAAARASVAPRVAYKLRREDAEFATRWRAALCEGYDNLEMELLGYLRNPQPGRKMDVPSALRQLAAHRATVERQRALTAEQDEQASIEAIDRFIEDMRLRRLANTAILAEADGEAEATSPETGDGMD
jgi:hypothetical protein